MTKGIRARAMLGCAVLGLGVGAPAAAQNDINSQVQASIREAFCPKPTNATAAAATTATPEVSPYIEPTRVFDNLYFVGDRTTSAWVLTTSKGYILIDAGFHHNVETTIVPGIKKLGLKPERIKYVIVSHGHNDHFGGAKFLQKTYGAKIVMSADDWSHMRTWPQRGSPAPFPNDDVVVRDGDVIRLGDASVRMVVTPGHTPGTLSPYFQVKDGRKKHLVGYWGGDGAGHLPADEIRVYMASADRFMSLDKNLDVPLSNHVVADGTVQKLALLKARRKGEAHPFVAGNAEFRAWASQLKNCAGAFLPAS
jgi:metallo-beta-lactamase class B